MPCDSAAPMEQLRPEDVQKTAPQAGSLDLGCLERRLDEWMQHLDHRLDSMMRCMGAESGLQTAAPHSETSVGWCKEVWESRAHSKASRNPMGETRAGDEDPTTNADGSVSLQPAHSAVARSTSDEYCAQRFSYLKDRILTRKVRDCDARWLPSIVRSPWFDVVISVVVVANVFIFGLQVDIGTRLGQQAVGPGFQRFEYACTLIFTCELVLRLRVFGLVQLLIFDDTRAMFIVDSALVLLAWADIIVTALYDINTMGDTAVFGKVLKIIRAARTLRVLRTLPMLAELRVMAIMIVSSFRSIMWLLVIILVVTYNCALVLTLGAASVLHSDTAPSDQQTQELRVAFGSLLSTMYTLLKCMTGGRNWGEAADIISQAGGFFSGIIVAYMILNMFSILNIVTGVFVDSAIEHAKRDRSLIVQKKRNKREALAKNLIALLLEMDSTGSGQVNEADFLASMRRRDVKDYLEAMSIDIDDAEKTFRALDRDIDGTVDIFEFVHGMERMQATAKSIELESVAMRMHHVEHLLLRLHHILTQRDGQALEASGISSTSTTPLRI
mmetsp:Transcript_22116/g.63368  ORF Transcript_22116/g.63368 Transcript_22116/m.63368 type:complete len:556 (+) Transcript_22116:47-1714(+)|eukprot:CAMPEP_0170252434 /NCGR_PEP_ID=MMETSP0116_2-20130129/26051_1 /TAXON_ID=400756 /ORGANISM="Durinskia baltica, Strain CSIRO CS-38" /LENGTH=555 /DNA_ID=CAMNT_0010503405 /DNA_START=33 /DNA_END=1700 /DNA_ORIENTATION=+